MSFWQLSDGTNAAATTDKEYDSGGGFDNTPLPKGTSVLVSVEEAVWKAGYQVEEEFVNLKCRVLKPEGYASRVLWFKLWVGDLDPSLSDEKGLTKRDKHRKMMIAIDANGKGRLAKLTGSPTNDQLALALTNVQFVATLGVWDKEDPSTGGKVPGGNWLMAARPKSAQVSEGPRVAAKKPLPVAGFDDDLDDDPDVPF